MLGRPTASQIASASLASFFPRLRCWMSALLISDRLRGKLITVADRTGDNADRTVISEEEPQSALP